MDEMSIEELDEWVKQANRINEEINAQQSA
jgi:hypothetical protein